MRAVAAIRHAIRQKLDRLQLGRRGGERRRRFERRGAAGRRPGADAAAGQRDVGGGRARTRGTARTRSPARSGAWRRRPGCASSRLAPGDPVNLTLNDSNASDIYCANP